MTVTGSRRPRLPLVLGALLPPATVLLAAAPAAAHTELRGSTPAPGAAVSASTTQVVLSFSGPARERLSTVVVTGPDGADHARGGLRTRGSDVVQAVDGPLPPGPWTVAYRVVAEDGHPITGTVAFTVARPAAPARPVAGVPDRSPATTTAPATTAPATTAPTTTALPVGAAAGRSPAEPVARADPSVPVADEASSSRPLAAAGGALLALGLAAAFARRCRPGRG